MHLDPVQVQRLVAALLEPYQRRVSVELLANLDTSRELEAAVKRLRENLVGNTYVGDILGQIRSILLETPSSNAEE